MQVLIDRPVSARSLTDVAVELERPLGDVLRAARALHVYLVPLGKARVLYVSPLSVPVISEYLRVGVVL
jgi:hypothetical protein